VSELKELLEFAVELSRGAGEITLQYFRKQPETSTKADGSYVTIADRQAEEYLRQQIAARFPDDGVLVRNKPKLAAGRDAAGSSIRSTAPLRLCMAFRFTAS